jgi:hypothetical protein
MTIHANESSWFKEETITATIPFQHNKNPRCLCGTGDVFQQKAL